MQLTPLVPAPQSLGPVLISAAPMVGSSLVFSLNSTANPTWSPIMGLSVLYPGLLWYSGSSLFCAQEKPGREGKLTYVGTTLSQWGWELETGFNSPGQLENSRRNSIWFSEVLVESKLYPRRKTTYSDFFPLFCLPLSTYSLLFLGSVPK